VLNLKSESLGLTREVTEKKEEIVIPKRQFVNLDLNWPAEW
jgi:hypothetical protein